MGGTMKGAHGHMHAAAYSSNNSRRKWSNVYIVMVIVCCVFGCGILGLMGIHRLRERRSLNLIIKEKDDQILSLHLLLQKEREHVVEAKRKTEEMKMKMTSLGSQKAELSSKMSEMQSTISSLREEQRAVESAFQEKQSEANLMREKYTQINEQNPQVEALKEELRKKEGEVEDLKLRLHLQGAEVGSNATMAEAKIHESEAVIETSSENGGTANADRTSDGDEVEPTSKKGHENEKATDDQESEVQGNPHRFRGKHGYLRRAKGKRWRSIGKQTQGKRASLSNGASTMADSALRNSSAESTRASLQELAKSSETKMEENEQSEEEISIVKPTDDKDEHQHTDVLGRKGVAETNGEESEDTEETNEPEF